MQNSRRDLWLMTAAMTLAVAILGYVAYVMVTTQGSAVAATPIILILIILYVMWGMWTGKY